MKIFFTFFLLVCSYISNAQWSNTTNQFYDSLAMPVATDIHLQANTIIVRSYPDSGYFFIWENQHEAGYNHAQLFAQKYDKNGKRLWADDGIAIATSPKPLYYNKNIRPADSDPEIRDFSFAATDSANGFYLTYFNDSTGHAAVMVQHIRQDGTPVFANSGFTVMTDATNPQLIPDGNKGFFVGFYYNKGLFVHCYRDENGTMKWYGGGRVDAHAIEEETGMDEFGNTCIRTIVIAYPTLHCDGNYMLYPNLQNGCEVVMAMHKDFLSDSEPWDYGFTASNELFRVKSATQVSTGDPLNPAIEYKNDSVIVLYQVRIRSEELTCTGGTGIAANYFLVSDGFQRISENYDFTSNPKGTMVSTDGDINIDIIGVTEKVSGQLPIVKVYYRFKEKYESIPYAFTIPGPYLPPFTLGVPPPGHDKVNWGSDTLFYSGTNTLSKFSLVTSANKIYASCFPEEQTGSVNDILIQQLKVEREASDSFAVVLNTKNRNGVKIANEVITGNSATQVQYNPPAITVDGNGNALFYIVERAKNRLLRISPIADSGRLMWGPVGKAVRNIYNINAIPFVYLSPVDGTGIITWPGFDHSSSPGMGIFMRHLDSLNDGNYLPPVGKIKLLPDGLQTISPGFMMGLTGKWNTINADDNHPVVGLLDNNNLGAVKVTVYENQWPGGIRFYNGKPYLDRNFTITPQNTPTVPQKVRLYFTNEELDALKAADPSITGPEMLEIVKQENATGDAPHYYVATGAEENITPDAWGAMDGGYYLEFTITGFSNFFIQKTSEALPVTWIDVQAKWADKNNVQISWQITNQVNVKKYNVQHSLDGILFNNICEVPASNTDFYTCTVPVAQGQIHYYRVQQTDIDGKNSFSKVVMLSSHTNEPVSVFPNPVSSKMQITGLYNYKEYSITDISGRILLRGKTTPSDVIDVSFLHSGTYILKLIGNEDSRSLKFIKN